MVLDRPDRVRVQAEEVVERDVVAWAVIDLVLAPAGTASAQAAELNRPISGENHVLL
jgi:hypothetical protein